MRRSLAVTGVLACALALGACDDGEGNGEAGGNGNGDAGAVEDGGGNGQVEDLVSAVKESTEDAETAKFTLDMDMAEQKINGEGEGSYGEEASVAMSMNTGDQAVEMRQVDGALFVKMPEEAGGDPERPWVDFSQDEQMTQMLGGMDQMIAHSDPRRTLDQVAEAGTITGSEDDDVDGAAVTRHQVDIELARLSENMPIGMDEGSIQQLRQAGAESFPVELVVNEDNLLVQHKIDMTEIFAAAAESAGQPAGEGESIITMNYSEWGESVDVQAPPEDEIGEMPEMQQPAPQPEGDMEQPPPEMEDEGTAPPG
jgi:hypothetical protein